MFDGAWDGRDASPRFLHHPREGSLPEKPEEAEEDGEEEGECATEGVL